MRIFKKLQILHCYVADGEEKVAFERSQMKFKADEKFNVQRALTWDFQSKQ